MAMGLHIPGSAGQRWGKEAESDTEQSKRLAALGGLREIIEIADAMGALETIRCTDPHLEMGALYELSLKHRFPPAWLFEEIGVIPWISKLKHVVLY